MTGTPATVALSAERIKAEAYALGFDLAGIAALGTVNTAPQFEAWLARGYAGTMSYLERGADKRRDTRLPFPGTRAAIVVAMNYGGTEPAGPVARYARGRDYHDVLLEKLQQLHRWLESEVGRPIAGKPYVDTGPILERDLAQRAGLGWFGKNTMLINPKLGSFFFLGSLLVDLDIAPDEPFEVDRCGTCRRCIDACPTGAIVDERVLDATRCVSYLTIELREEIPPAFRSAMGEMLFGCDICQDVCPWNVSFARTLPAGSPLAPRAALREKEAHTLAREILEMSAEEYATAFKNSAIKRAKLRGLKRNAAVVLGNTGDERDTGALSLALQDPEAIVREHAAWALDQIGTSRPLSDVQEEFSE